MRMLALGGLLFLTACNPQAQNPVVAVESKAAMDAKDFATEADDPTDRILISDTKVYPDQSGERILGDGRPLYVAEGRVTSNLLYANADQIVLKVRFVDKNNDGLDTAEVTLNNIAPQETKAFRQVVPLLPPTGKAFNFVIEVDSVKTSPSPHPYPFNR